MIYLNKIRTNDLAVNDSGAQFELGKGFMKTHNWGPGLHTLEVTFKTIDERYSYLNEMKFKSIMKVRGSERGGEREGGDCKEYFENNDNQRPFINFFGKTLNLTDEVVNKSYFALQDVGKSGEKFNLYYIDQNTNIIDFCHLLEQKEVDINTDDIDTEIPNKENRNIIGRNIIYYGVPGAGKSHTIEKDYNIDDGNNIVERVVFHPDYTYSDFVGQIMPKVETEKDTENNTAFSRVSYEFKPGPFTNILRLANENPNKQHILIIEEINRGNAPAIFGDLFQLLDRKEDGSSRYSINNSDIANVVYLDNFPEKKVYLPSNLTIVATMNTSDQNVFTLDTAFQRRWEMRLIENKFRSDHTFADKEILDTKVTWRTFCETMNRVIVGNGARTTSTEDKRLGVYFIKAQDIDLGDKSVNQLRKFPEKVIKYLWDDAFKFNREDLFNTIYHSLEDVIEAFMGKTGPERFNIFKADIINQLNVVKETKQENTETLNEANQQ